MDKRVCVGILHKYNDTRSGKYMPHGDDVSPSWISVELMIKPFFDPVVRRGRHVKQ